MEGLIIEQGLKQYCDQRMAFQGMFKFTKTRHRGNKIKHTLLVEDLTNMEGDLLLDHIWLDVSPSVAKFMKENRDRPIEFDATVVMKLKGYLGRNRAIDNPMKLGYILVGVRDIRFTDEKLD